MKYYTLTPHAQKGIYGEKATRETYRVRACIRINCITFGHPSHSKVFTGICMDTTALIYYHPRTQIDPFFLIFSRSSLFAFVTSTTRYVCTLCVWACDIHFFHLFLSSISILFFSRIYIYVRNITLSRSSRLYFRAYLIVLPRRNSARPMLILLLCMGCFLSRNPSPLSLHVYPVYAYCLCAREEVKERAQLRIYIELGKSSLDDRRPCSPSRQLVIRRVLN